MKLNKRINFFLLFIILLLFIKTDYRLETEFIAVKTIMITTHMLKH